MNEYPSRQEKFRIEDADWERGWRYGFREAVDTALAGQPDGTEVKIEQIWVKKRGDTSFHDYRIVITTP
jgi:hypothetical protein